MDVLVSLPQVVLVVCQPHGYEHVGAQLHEALVQLLGHKIEPVG